MGLLLQHKKTTESVHYSCLAQSLLVMQLGHILPVQPIPQGNALLTIQKKKGNKRNPPWQRSLSLLKWKLGGCSTNCIEEQGILLLCQLYFNIFRKQQVAGAWMPASSYGYCKHGALQSLCWLLARPISVSFYSSYCILFTEILQNKLWTEYN